MSDNTEGDTEEEIPHFTVEDWQAICEATGFTGIAILSKGMLEDLANG